MREHEKLCRQYGCHPEVKGRVVDTACAVIALRQAKAPTIPTGINTFHCNRATHEVLLKKTAKQQGVNLCGELHEGRGCSMTKGLRKLITKSTYTRAGTLCPSRASAATAPHCRRGEVYSGGGRKRGGRFNPRQREDGRIGQRVQPRHHNGGVAPGATHNARGVSSRTWSRGRGGADGNPPTPSVFPVRAEFGGTNGSTSSSSSSSSDDSRTSNDSSDSSKSNDSGDFLALARRLARDMEVFGELLALQSGRTMSQSRDLTMSTVYTDALLAYAMRAVEAKRTMEEKVAEIEGVRD